METRVIQWCTYQKNIDRYKGLLKTKLSEAERQYLEKLVCEETIGMLTLIEHQLKKEGIFWSTPTERNLPQNKF